MTTLGESWRERRITQRAIPETSDGRSTHSGTSEPTFIGVAEGTSECCSAKPQRSGSTWTIAGESKAPSFWKSVRTPVQYFVMKSSLLNAARLFSPFAAAW